jgi:hypothetical protein
VPDDNVSTGPVVAEVKAIFAGNRVANPFVADECRG